MIRQAARDLNGALEDATLIEPWAVFAVEALDVLDIAIAQGAHHGASFHRFTVLQAVGQLNHFSEHSVVFGSMPGEAGKSGLLHQLLLAREVHARELDELVKYFADLFVAATVHQGEAQLIDCVHEDAMLVVHGTDVNGAGVVPG